MTEHTTCTRRGCHTRCTADHCLTTGQHDHPPIPRRATVGLLCQLCSDRLLEAVADIPDLAAQMPSLYDTSHTEGGEKVHRGKISGSPALIRLDVMVLNGWGQAGDGVLPLWATIYHWLDTISDTIGIEPDDDDLTTIAGFLKTWHQNITRQPWIDQYWHDIVSLRTALRRTTGAPPPIGRCFGHIANRPCGRLLYPPPPGQTEIVCPDEHCGRRYTGADLVKLEIQGEREGVS